MSDDILVYGSTSGCGKVVSSHANLQGADRHCQNYQAKNHHESEVIQLKTIILTIEVKHVEELGEIEAAARIPILVLASRNSGAAGLLSEGLVPDDSASRAASLIGELIKEAIGKHGVELDDETAVYVLIPSGDIPFLLMIPEEKYAQV